MIERKWKPENHKLEDAFFPVELCDLKFVYPTETDLFGKVIRTKDVPAWGHKAVVDINKCHVFATVTDKYTSSAKPGFNMSYLGVDAVEAATWYDSITAA